MNSKIVLFSKTFCKKAEWLLNVPFDLEYCLILIYRLKLSDRACNFRFPNKLLWWGKCIFTIEKVLMGI